MMAERLAELRRDLDAEAYTSYLPKTVRELLDHIAQLEAQRGANVLATCANCAQRGHCVHAKLGEACEDHIVQRGWAVVVPAWNRSDFDKVPPEWSEMQCFGAGYELAASRIQPIPAGGALADGMVGVEG